MLPKMSGLDVCRDIRDAQRRADHHRERKGRRDRHGPDARDRRRRLRHQALPAARARRAHSRRPASTPGCTTTLGPDEVIALGNIRLDIDARRCFVDSEEIKLRKKEFALLRLLLENPGRVLTREVLIDRVWGSDYVGDTKTLDVHIKRLRTLIEEDPKAPTHITTVRGVGYRYEVTKA